MAGGAGTRLWPLSTSEHPKPFLALAGGLTLFQQTVMRVGGPGAGDFGLPLVIGSATHETLIREQLAQVGVSPLACVLEPHARNTAAVAGLAAEVVGRLRPGSLALLLPADHVIGDEAAFRAAVRQAAPPARERLVALGVRPTAPETGYGYIRMGAPLSEGGHEISQFIEKPERKTAEALLADGGCLWNAGVFLFAPERMRGELRLHAPEVAAAVDAALTATIWQDGVTVRPDPAAMERCPSVSLDVAVMEPTRVGAVVEAAFAWADVGSWSEVWRLGPRDEADNLLHGAVSAIDSTGTVLWGEGVRVAAIGVSDLIVIATRDTVLVVPRNRAQEVRRLAGLTDDPPS